MSETKVLLVEDEAVIAMDMRLTLEENGYTVVGPFKSEAKALARLEETLPAVAVLDINLGRGGTSFEIARRLIAQDVPVIFLTGYTAATVSIPEDLGNVTRLMKPVQDEQLLGVMADLVAA